MREAKSGRFGREQEGKTGDGGDRHTGLFELPVLRVILAADANQRKPVGVRLHRILPETRTGPGRTAPTLQGF